jgi:hypothetical protein
MNFNQRHSLLLIFLLFTSYSQLLKAQNYAAIKVVDEYTFLDSINMNIISIHIDSLSSSGSEVQYYNFRQLRPTDYGCYVLGGSWLGDEVIEEANGTFIFMVYPFSPPDSSNTYRILTRAATGHPWTFYSYHNNTDRIEAVVSSVEWRSFIGLSDSVKVITLTRKNASGQVIADPINTQQILLSKNYGLIRLPKFDETLDFQQFYVLSGKSGPETGITNLTTMKIYDFQPGDEFHTVEHTEGFASSSGSYTQSSILKIFERTEYPLIQSVGYAADRCESSYYWASDTSYSYSYAHDTIHLQCGSSTSFLDSEPLAPVYLAPYWTVYTFMGFLNDPSIPITDVPYKAYNSLDAWTNVGDCFQPVMIDNCNFDYIYFKGLGGPYYDCHDLGYGHSYKHLNYYKKGNVVWGNPLNCDSLFEVGMNEPSCISEIKLYPNPTHGFLNIEIPGIDGIDQPRLEILDLSGRIVEASVIKMSNERVDLLDLTPGIYLCIIKNKSGELLYRSKIIR